MDSGYQSTPAGVHQPYPTQDTVAGSQHQPNHAYDPVAGSDPSTWAQHQASHLQQGWALLMYTVSISTKIWCYVIPQPIVYDNYTLSSADRPITLCYKGINWSVLVKLHIAMYRTCSLAWRHDMKLSQCFVIISGQNANGIMTGYRHYGCSFQNS